MPSIGLISALLIYSLQCWQKVGPGSKIISKYLTESWIESKKYWYPLFIGNGCVQARLYAYSTGTPALSAYRRASTMAAMLGGVDIGSPSAANVHASH